MESFIFCNKTRLIFGLDAEKQFLPYIPAGVKRILLHYGGGSVIRSGLLARVENLLREAGYDLLHLGGVQSNPRLTLVQRGISLCRKENVEFILAIGGGSVIDSAKAISFGVHYPGDVWDFFSGGGKAKDTLPVGCILTIPASGSESSMGAVITNDQSQKRCGEGEDSRPIFAVLNPALTCTLPAYQTACGIADMMAHVMERYFTPTVSRNLTDALCEGTLRTIIRNGRMVMQDPDNLDARSELMLAGTIAHNDMLSMGRTGDWACHWIEHELSGFYDIAHGAGLAIIFPAWMRYLQNKHEDMFAQFARNVWGVSAALSDSEAAEEGIVRLQEFWKSLGLPVTLQQAGICDDTHFEEMASGAVQDGPLGNLERLSREDVLRILRSCK